MSFIYQLFFIEIFMIQTAFFIILCQGFFLSIRIFSIFKKNQEFEK
jgi:hypothetical protein